MFGGMPFEVGLSFSLGSSGLAELRGQETHTMSVESRGVFYVDYTF